MVGCGSTGVCIHPFVPSNMWCGIGTAMWFAAQYEVISSDEEHCPPYAFTEQRYGKSSDLADPPASLLSGVELERFELPRLASHLFCQQDLQNLSVNRMSSLPACFLILCIRNSILHDAHFPFVCKRLSLEEICFL